jgi:hypothetical protein
MVGSEQVSFLRGLKGAPASIVLALALTGCSMTGRDLQMVTGYSDKPISQGLALLELHGLVQFNGRAQGWSFRHEARLSLFPTALLGGKVGLAQSTGRGDRSFSDFTASSSAVVDDGDFGGSAEEAEVLEPGRSIAVERWLTRAGVGRRSPKMRELLALDLDPGYVAAWVLEYEWYVAEMARRPGERVNGRRQFSTGTLIRILLDGDAAPPERCEACLERPGDCYCSVVQS